VRAKPPSLSRLRSVFRSKKGVAGVLVAAYVALGLIHDFLDFLRDVAYATKHADPVMSVLVAALNFLTTGLGNLVDIIIAAVLILWALQQQQEPEEAIVPATSPTDPEDVEKLRAKLGDAEQEIERLRIGLNNRPPRRFEIPVETLDLRTADDANEIEELKAESERLRGRIEKAATEVGLPPNVATEGRIANCDFRILDLLRLAGTDGSYIVEKEFENCTIRGPGIITREGKPPGDKGTHGTVSHVPTLYLEGSPDSVLYEVLPNATAANGVIHLVGCSYKRVTFSSVGIAGSPGEIAWWREHATFSEPASHE
jgi:hypothetical protein